MPSSPACGLSPPTKIFGRAMPSCLSAASVTRITRSTRSRRDQRDRLAHADMQRGVDDAHVVEADHQIDVVDRRAGFARDERGIAVEGDAGGRDRAFGLRRRHHRLHLAGERGFDRAAGAGERGAAVSGVDLAEYHRRVGAVAGVEQVDRAVRPVGIAGFGDRRAAAARDRPLSHAVPPPPGRPPASGRQSAVTRASSAALSAISGPIPAGSPVAMAMRGKLHGRLSRRARAAYNAACA